MYCRLQQQVSSCQETRRPFSRQPNKYGKTIFAKYGIPRKLMLDVDTNFVSDKFHQFCKLVNTEQATLSAYHHQSNRQVEACIKFIKHTFKNALIQAGT